MPCRKVDSADFAKHFNNFFALFCIILNCFDMYALQVARGDFETARSTLGEAVERNGETRLSE